MQDISTTQSFFALDKRDLKESIERSGHSSASIDQVLKGVYGLNPKAWEDNPQISDSLITTLKSKFDLSLPKFKTIKKSEDGTIKFLVEFSDGVFVETVALKFFKKYTLCLSTQAGCAMKCSFCFTGTQGLERNLKDHEIVAQYFAVYRYLVENELTIALPNIVFMGQGEPLHNFENLKKALHILTTIDGLKLSPKQITLSTCGYLPGIKRFKELPDVNWALSLHSTKEDLRNELIPINQKYPLKDVLAELRKIPKGKKHFVTIEYLIMKGLNDKLDDVEDLSHKLEGIPALINLIPFNEYPGAKYKRPSDTQVEWFKEELAKRKLRTFIRGTKGDDILAACGQLANT